MREPSSLILLTDRFDEEIDALRREYPEAQIVPVVAEEDFLVEHAKEAVEKAYLTSEREKIVVLAARFFTPIAQNKLLKILEEPPPATHFVLMTPSKASLLPTVRSRMVVENRMPRRGVTESGMDLERFDLARFFDLLAQNRRIDAKKATELVEAIGAEVMRSGRYRLDEELLDTLQQSVKLLDMGSPPLFVLSRLGLKLLEKRR